MRNPSASSAYTPRGMGLRLLACFRSCCPRMSQRVNMEELFIPVFVLLPIMIASFIPFFYFILPQYNNGITIGGVIIVLLLLMQLSFLALRGTDPGFLISDKQIESPLQDIDSLEILHKWAATYPHLIQARDHADDTLPIDADEIISLATGTDDGTKKERLAEIVLRMKQSAKLGEEGQADQEEAIRDLQALFGPPQAPEGGYTLQHLPPAPSRPHFISPAARKHPVVEYDAELEAAEEARLERQAPSVDRATRRARKKERKARQEKARYETRRKDGDLPVRDSAFEERKESKEQHDSMASATETEDEDNMRSRAPIGNGDATNSNGVIPNPFANADNFFRHDFDAHPVDERERASLVAKAKSETLLAKAVQKGAAPTDAFFVGNPRWHPNKLRDDCDRFAMDRWGLREEFCLECMVWRPLGAKHCPKCRLCVNHAQGHNGLMNCCIGKLNMRFMLAIQLILLIVTVMAAYCSQSVFWRHHPLSWSSWRVPVESLNENGTPMYTWQWMLFIYGGLAGSWTMAAISALVLFLGTMSDVLKSANYILLAEGGGLRADAPLNRMRMNPLQLLLYASISDLLSYLAILLFTEIDVGWPCFRQQNLQARRAEQARALAKERRREWRMLREQAVQAAKLKLAANTTSSSETTTNGAPVSPHHAVEITS